MGRKLSFAVIASTLIAVLAACESARLPVAAGTGSDPALPPPVDSLIPTVHVATATGWADGGAPLPATGLRVDAFASGLDHPRWLYVLPNGDVLVAETNGPPREGAGGIRGWFMRMFFKRAGAAVPSANRITLLRDTDADGRADVRTHFLEGLHSPFGMALVDDTLYVANTDALMRFDYREGATRIDVPGKVVVSLPAGRKNQHWTRNVIADERGERLYVSVGSASNVAEHGIREEENRASILEVDPATGTFRTFASGLRNPVGLAWNPDSGALWTSVNERDELGSDLVPDYMTSLKDGGFYGWPYSYYGQHLDERVRPQRPDLVAKALRPDYALGPHTGSLGLTLYDAGLLPAMYRGGAFVGQHGSWNRRPRSGYRVIFVPFENGMPSGPPQDVLTGFLSEDGEARGRPVGVAVDRSGALLVADDVGNVIWRVTPQN